MAKFHKLKIADIRKETADCVSIAFAIPDNLKQDFNYLQGQYLTLKFMVNGEELRRSYSLCSSPVADNEYRIAVKRVNAGKGSNYLTGNLKVGDELEVMTPMGNFYTATTATAVNYVLFAGGSGITPMLSIIKTILKAADGSSIKLFYGNLNEESVIFKKELDQLAAQSNGKLTVIYILDKPVTEIPELQRGMLTTEKVKALISTYVSLQQPNEFYICGPTPMMDNVREVLETLNVKKEHIHIEYFTAVTEAPVKTETIAEGSSASKVTVILDGEEHAFELSANGASVLDAALDAGLDVPFACKGAVCCTCRAKIKEGKVAMDNNFALTDDEVKKGYILTCQSHPLTPVVIIDYDV